MSGNHFREYAELVLETLGARAVVHYGNFDEAIGVIKRSIGQLVLAREHADRDAIAKALGVSVRTLDAWIRMAKDYEAEAVKDEDSLHANTLAGRLFFAIATFLDSAGDQYRSLGTIVDHVKATLAIRPTTDEIRRRLEAYVDLGLLEHHPADQEMYRAKVRTPVWSHTSSRYVKALLGYLFPTLFGNAHQVYASDPGALARVVYYEVPEEDREAFTHKVIEEMRGVKERLERYEHRLREERPGSARVFVREVFTMGHGLRDRLVDDLYGRVTAYSLLRPSDD